MKLKNIYIDGEKKDLTVNGGIISSISPSKDEGTSQLWILPGMVNMHTHSAMTLLRSVGSGLPLQDWLHNEIFPREAMLTDDDVRRGAYIACDEMLSTGTTTFNDMYFHIHETMEVAKEAGMHGIVALSVTDRDFESDNSELRTILKEDFEPGKIRLSIAPHSIYAVSERHLRYLADFTAERGLPFHIHISETRAERENCILEHGIPPVAYLDRIGVLPKTGRNFIGAHALWLDKTEIGLLADCKANVVHCPNSNLKLGSGSRFLYIELRDAGVNVTLGTDGCASSDNLDMIEAMKVMSLLQKGFREDPSILPAEEVFRVATENGYRALGIAPASIKEGEAANFFSVDITRPVFDGINNAGLTAEQRKKLFFDRLIYASHGAEVVKFKD